MGWIWMDIEARKRWEPRAYYKYVGVVPIAKHPVRTQATKLYE